MMRHGFASNIVLRNSRRDYNTKARVFNPGDETETMSSEPKQTYHLAKSALAQILHIYPSIARVGVEGVDNWLLSLGQPEVNARLNKDVLLNYRGLCEHQIRPFMCDSVSLVFLPFGPDAQVVYFAKGTRVREALAEGGTEAAQLGVAIDSGKDEIERGDCLDREYTLAELRRIDEEKSWLTT
jgi:hypothetical protein